MVKVREDYPLNEDGSVDLDLWLDQLQQHIDLRDVAVVRHACEMAQQAYEQSLLTKQDSSDDAEDAAEESAQDSSQENGKDNSRRKGSYLTGLDMAQILAELQQDQDNIVAAILYRSVREDKLKLDTVENQFGPEVSKLIAGALQMAAIGSRANPRVDHTVLGTNAKQIDTVRKMLVAMIDDVRVVLIKIADRTCAIRSVKNASRRKRYLVAREVFDIYAPLAHRLGIGHIKWELEDLSFRYLKPNDYKSIASLLDEKRVARQQFIQDVVATLTEKLNKQNINAQVNGRAKHIYSIWRKMQNKSIDFHQVYDVRAVRILVPEVRDCYTALGIIHGLWRNIPHEFDDYIASPKPNGYRSLHTAVFGPEGKVLEVQVRTFDMHEEAELGVCAHHLYKGTDTQSKSDAYEDKINWLRQVLEWHENLGETEGIGDMLRGDVVQDRLYVFTPDGHVIDMPIGATALDFAYRVHTEVGHRCRGAKVNGRILPLNRQLQTGDQVEILTAKEANPRRDWMNVNLGYLTTSRARARVAQWFKLQDRDKNVEAGRQILEREFKRLAIDLRDLNLDLLAKDISFNSIEDVFAALGAGDIRLAQILNAAQSQIGPVKQDEQLALELPNSSNTERQTGDSSIRILGVGNLLTTMATCCKPVPGDRIAGFITQGRGISIHRDDCANLMNLRQSEPEKVMEVDWGEEGETTYPVDINVEAYDRSGLLRDVMMVLANENLNVLAANTLTNRNSNVASLALTVEVSRLEKLGRIMDKIHQIPNVLDVHRLRSGFNK